LGRFLSFFLVKQFSSFIKAGRLVGLLILLLAGPVTRAQAPAWQMAVITAPNSGSNSFIQASATDATGNVYVTGYFTGTVSFGNTTLVSAGGNDAFVAQWSPASNTFGWAYRAGGSGDEYASAIVLQGSNIYMAGSFNSASISFGNNTLTNASAGTQDLFVAKLTITGNTSSFIWAQRAGNANNEGVGSLAINGSSIYLSGRFNSLTLTFGSTTLRNTSTNISTLNGYDIFLAKLTDTGAASSFAWAQAINGTGDEITNGLAVRGTSVYITGSFDFAITLGTLALATPTFSSLFFAKLTDAGPTSSFTWVQQATSADFSIFTNAVAVNGSNIYVAGFFYGASVLFGSTTLSNAGDREAFVVKLIDAGASGSFTWAHQAGGINGDGAYAIAVNGANVYIAGHFASPTAAFGSITLANSVATGFSDVFVAKLIDAGPTSSFSWAQQAGGPSTDAANALAITGNTLYVAGNARPPATFGSFVTTGPVGATAGFLASLTDPTLTATTPALSGPAFTLAPNPAHTATTVQLPAQPGTPTATLTLLDALGRRMKTETVALSATGLHHELNVAGLPAGLYALQVQAGAATATRKLVVE
jgi:hypothetical protein